MCENYYIRTHERKIVFSLCFTVLELHSLERKYVVSGALSKEYESFMFAFSGERSTHFLFQIARMIILFTLSIFHRLFIENNLSHALGVSKSLLDEKLSSQSFP